MRHVIVGNGVAGITAATELATRHAGEIVVYTTERYPYYFRPQLPRFLAGELAQERLFARPPAWYDEQGIRVHLGQAVVRLLPDQHRVVLADGSEVAYDRLLLATGAVPAVPPVEGAGRRGVFTLRTLDDALAIREYAARSRHAVVIGGGLLGLEAARGLLGLGLTVTVLEFFSRLMPRQLDEEGAALFRVLVERLGLQVTLNARTQAFLGDEAVQGVRLEDGREIPAQMVLVCTGVRCNADLAAAAGLTVNRGVVVDTRMSTSVPDIYAAGDLASFNGRSWGIIPQARAQALVAAANMAGEEATYEEVVPSTTLKITGIDLTSCGVAVPEGEGFLELRHTDPAAGIYRKLVLQGDVAVGAIVIGDRDAARRFEALTTAHAPLSREEATALVKG